MLLVVSFLLFLLIHMFVLLQTVSELRHELSTSTTWKYFHMKYILSSSLALLSPSLCPSFITLSFCPLPGMCVLCIDVSKEEKKMENEREHAHIPFLLLVTVLILYRLESFFSSLNTKIP